MKKNLLLAAVLTVGGACASSSSDRPSTADERQAKIQRERHDADYTRERTEPDADERAERRRARASDDDATDEADERVDEANERAADEHAADNTGRNARDDEPGHVTALDQSNSESDIEITQAIRKSVIANDDLSFNAKNVKIITVAGKVTLRGPVESAAERAAIEKSAHEVQGVVRVDNQIEVER